MILRSLVAPTRKAGGRIPSFINGPVGDNRGLQALPFRKPRHLHQAFRRPQRPRCRPIPGDAEIRGQNGLAGSQQDQHQLISATYRSPKRFKDVRRIAKHIPKNIHDGVQNLLRTGTNVLMLACTICTWWPFWVKPSRLWWYLVVAPWDPSGHNGTTSN